ncbi:MAG: veratrol--corrinoid protein metyltransferase [Eubacteriaceae bacterium]|nr:veratrol--corrinoid protein metyltransferase [Eubacteriaceae bacterium]
MITPKENYMMMVNGEIPEYVPSGNYQDRVQTAVVGMQAMFGGPGPGGGPPRDEWVDNWGVPHVAVKEAGNAGIPKPGAFILEDITKWDKVVKAPEVPDFDWEANAKTELENIDRKESLVSSFLAYMPFQRLVAFMGFTEGLCALSEEPESVKEMLNYIADYYVPFVEKLAQHYKPDVMTIFDDTASKYAPFFSVQMYRDIFKPIYERLAKPITDIGGFIDFHNCGRCEDFVGDMIDFGSKTWNPAQVDNDLLAIKEKYKGQIAVCGGWEFVPNPDEPVSEEEIRQSVRDSIDKYAPGGGYAFGGGVLGTADDAELTRQINGWVADEAFNYGSSFYKTH